MGVVQTRDSESRSVIGSCFSLAHLTSKSVGCVVGKRSKRLSRDELSVLKETNYKFVNRGGQSVVLKAARSLEAVAVLLSRSQWVHLAVTNTHQNSRRKPVPTSDACILQILLIKSTEKRETVDVVYQIINFWHHLVLLEKQERK